MAGAIQEGTIFADRYRVVRRIASGGMGTVYEVVHLETERRRALKVMHSHILQSEEMRQRFKLETKVAAHIESDFIVDVFDAGFDEPTQSPYLVMELLRGEDLSKRLKRLGPLSPGEVVLYLYQAALALDKTHKAAIVHRDLKPENLFLAEREDSPPRIKVLDFGIAKIVAESTTRGGSTESLGTPLYMSPEQFNPTIRLSSASDIYALGMIAYTLIVGVTDWFEDARGGNIFALSTAAVHGPQKPASARAAARGVVLPPAFDPWFAKVTAANPSHRFPTAIRAVRALAEVFGVPLPMAGAALAQSGISFLQSGVAQADSQRPALASAPDQWVVAAPFPAALPPFGPETTSLGTSVTRPWRQERGKARLVAIGLAAIGVWGIGGGIFYGVRSHRMSPAADGEAQGAEPTASTEAPAPPATAPAVPSSALILADPAMGSASPKPEPSTVADSSKAASRKRGDKPLAMKPPPAESARAAKKRYTQD